MPIDYKKYPPNWKELRKQVLARAKDKCEFCGVPNYSLIERPTPNTWKLAPEGHLADAMAMDGIKFVKVVLTIAHLDHDEENHSVTIDRLKALCQQCHLRYDVKEKKRRRKVKQDKITTLINNSDSIRLPEAKIGNNFYVHNPYTQEIVNITSINPPPNTPEHLPDKPKI